MTTSNNNVTDISAAQQLLNEKNAYRASMGISPIGQAPQVNDEAIAKTIDDTKKNLAKVAYAMKKRYPADYKAYLKTIDEITNNLLEHKLSNAVLTEQLLKVMKEIREHPAAKDASTDESMRTSALDMFAKKHSIVIYGGKTCIRREDTHEWILPEQLRQFMAHKETIGADGKPQNIVSAFMEWDNAPRYSAVIFDPAKPGHHGGQYNLWQGWTVEPEEGDDDAQWWEILEAACGYNIEYIEYVTKWMADIVQNPARKPGTAIGVSGPQGAGKSAWVETMGMLMANINDVGTNKIISGAFGDFTVDELLADYNEHVANKLCVYLDEATWGGSPAEAQRMKKVITKTYETINPKFLGRITVPCYRREIFSSNNAFYYRPDKDDRRLLPLEFDTSIINGGNSVFWNTFYDKRKNGKMLQNLLKHLMEIDLSDWHPQDLKKLNISTGEEMMNSTMQPFEHWLKQIAEDGYITIEEQGDRQKFESKMPIENQFVDDENFEEAWLLWAKKHKQSGFWGADAFKKERTKMLGKQDSKQIKGTKHKGRHVPSCEEMLKRLNDGVRYGKKPK